MASKVGTMPMPNLWHLRSVAEKNAKACWICYKASSSVLITPDSKDFFYICPGHLTDRTFCSPDEAEAAAIKERKEQKQKDQLQKEKERVIAEYEQKRKEREKKRAEKKKDKKAEEEEKKNDKKDDEEKKAKLEEIDKKEVKSEDKSEENSEEQEEKPRIFALKPVFFQQRIKRLKDIETAKKNAAMISNGLPSVPASKPGGP